jgi:hypothetical protein
MKSMFKKVMWIFRKIADDELAMLHFAEAKIELLQAHTHMENCVAHVQVLERRVERLANYVANL